MSGPRRRSSLGEEIAAGRELVVLADGPWARRWYWADELAGMQQAARRYPPAHPSGELQNYQRSTQQLPHPEEPELVGIAYWWCGAKRKECDSHRCRASPPARVRP